MGSEHRNEGWIFGLLETTWEELQKHVSWVAAQYINRKMSFGSLRVSIVGRFSN